MTIEELLVEARKTWGDEPMRLEHITVAMGVVYGDVCRQARAAAEGKAVDDAELKKELGNLIYSCVRWCDDLGYSPVECVEMARQAQAAYRKAR